MTPLFSRGTAPSDLRGRAPSPMPAEDPRPRFEDLLDTPRAKAILRCRDVYFILMDALADDYDGFMPRVPMRSTELPAFGVYPRGLAPRFDDDQMSDPVSDATPELVVELVDGPNAAGVGPRARELTAKGVRRVLAIVLHEREVREWSPGQDAWLGLDLRGALEDRVLAKPVPLTTLLEPTKDQVTAAMRPIIRKDLERLAKEEQEQAEREQAELAEQRRWLHRWRQGCIAMIDELCADRGLTLEEPVRERMQRLEQRQLLWLFNEIVVGRVVPRWVTVQRQEEPFHDADDA